MYTTGKYNKMDIKEFFNYGIEGMQTDKFKYEIIKECKQTGARIGRFTTPHTV